MRDERTALAIQEGFMRPLQGEENHHGKVKRQPRGLLQQWAARFRARGEVKVMSKALFALGLIVATPGAIEAMSAAATNGFEYLTRHVLGDWGDLSQDDKRENELSVREGFRILSAYTLRTGVKIWIITEADRTSTCFLLPSEY
jgi:hypothetical protein